MIRDAKPGRAANAAGFDIRGEIDQLMTSSLVREKARVVKSGGKSNARFSFALMGNDEEIEEIRKN
ncbi:MAG: hypothetical protein Q7R22_007995 [Verrucomicrobiota bacterium JB025]